MIKTRFGRFVAMVLAFVMALSFNVFAAAGKITFIVTGDSIHNDGEHTAYQEWINTSYELTDSVSVGDIMQSVLTANGYKYVYEDSGYGNYLSSITTPSGDELAEFTNGSKSGWMYKVNGTIPSTTMDETNPVAGDTVEIFYVDDYEAEIYGYYSTVNVTPSAANVVIKNSEGKVVEPSWGAYSLFNGDYTYKASADGYVSEIGDFTVSGAGVSLDITLREADKNVEWGLFRKDTNGVPVVKASTPTPDSVKVKWATKVKSGWSAMAGSVIANDYIYTVESSNLLKIDKTTGEIIAKATLDSSIGYTYFLSYGDGKVFVQLGKGQVEALNADDLTKVWTSEMPNGETNGQGLTPVYYNDGRVYAGSVVTGNTGSGYYYCLDSATGKNIWTITGDKGTYNGFYWSGATAVGDYIVFGGEGGTLRVVDEKGNVVDSYNVSADIRAGVTYSDGKIYFTDKTGYIHSMDITDGKLSNHKSVLINENATASTSTPAVYNGKVYVCAGGKYPSGYFSVFDTDLNQIYTYKTAYNAQSSPLISDNNGDINVYFTLNGPTGDLLVYDGTDCKSLIDLSTYKQYCIHSPIADNNGTIYYQNDSGNLVALARYGAEDILNNSPKNTDINTELSGDWSISNANDVVSAKTSSDNATMTVTVNGPAVFYYEMALSDNDNAGTLTLKNNGVEVATLTNEYTNKNYIVLGEGENKLTWIYSKSSTTDEQAYAVVNGLRAADKGDSNLDGKVDITDVVLGQKYLSDSSAITDTLGQKAINADGEITKADIANILKTIMKR